MNAFVSPALTCEGFPAGCRVKKVLNSDPFGFYKSFLCNFDVLCYLFRTVSTWMENEISYTILEFAQNVAERENGVAQQSLKKYLKYF